MRKFPISDEFRDGFKHAARRYLKLVERAKDRARSAEAVQQAHPRDSWQVDLAAALDRRAWDRVSRAEGRLYALIRSLAADKPVSAVEVFNDPSTPVAAFPAVEALGFVFALVGEDQNFVVRPAWMTVRVE